MTESTLHTLGSGLTRSSNPWLAGFQDKARSALLGTPFPTKKLEDWRFTSLKALQGTSLTAADPQAQASVDEESVSRYRLPECADSSLVFVNGVYRDDLSSLGSLPGATFHWLSKGNIPSELGDLFHHFAGFDGDAFTSLHTLLLQDALFIRVGEGAEIEAPVHVLNIQTGGSKATAEHGFASAFRTTILMEKGSRMTLIEEHVSAQDSDIYLNIPVIEAKVKGEAQLNHLRIQRENKACFHISRPVASLDQNAEYHSYTIALGAHLFRNEPRVIQEAENVNFTVDGLILIDGQQISDTHSTIDHRFSHGESHQLHKVVVNGSAHSIFNGKIFVRQDAQKIDSFQENRNLLLSHDGLVNTKPQLEIFADDVKCSHGATVGQLDEEEVFYLQSRGLTEEKAKEVLTYAFALETIENIKVESVHRFLIDEVRAYTRRNMRESLKLV